MRLRTFTFGAALVAILPFGLGCEESVKDAQEDVDKAKMEAQQEVQEKEQQVDEAKVEGQEKVLEEQQEVEKAQQEEAQKAPETPAPTP